MCLVSKVVGSGVNASGSIGHRAQDKFSTKLAQKTFENGNLFKDDKN